MAVRTPTNLSLPPELVAEIDAVAGPRNRSAFVEEAVRKALRRERLRIGMEQARGIITPEKYPEFATDEQVVQWVRDRRSEVTHVVPGTEWVNREK